MARNTVAEAYAELVAEGWLASRQGAGTWVVDAARRHPLPPRPARHPRHARSHNLMPGSPDVAEFPRSAWLASTRRALPNAPTEALRMGDPRGRIELREALAEYLGRARGVRTSPGFDRDLRGRPARRGTPGAGARRGPIAVEAYWLFIFRDALAAMGVPTVPIGVDDHGAVVDELDALDASRHC